MVTVAVVVGGGGGNAQGSKSASSGGTPLGVLGTYALAAVACLFGVVAHWIKAYSSRGVCVGGMAMLPLRVWLPENSATGTRTRVARVRAEYPNQLDYSGDGYVFASTCSFEFCDYVGLPGLELSSECRRSTRKKLNQLCEHLHSTLNSRLLCVIQFL